MKWDLTVDDRPVIYTLAFKVGHNVEDCNIVLEELNATSTEPPYTEAYNYFRCHDAKIGEGHISTAINKGRPNQRKSFKLNSKDTIINQFKDILLYNKSIYQSNFARTNVTDILNSLDKYFSRIRIYSSSQFNTKAMQIPVSTVNLDTDLLYDASNFVNIVNYYKSEDIRYIKTYTNKLQQLVHDLQDIDVVNMHGKK